MNGLVSMKFSSRPAKPISANLCASAENNEKGKGELSHTGEVGNMTRITLVTVIFSSVESWVMRVVDCRRCASNSAFCELHPGGLGYNAFARLDGSSNETASRTNGCLLDDRGSLPR